MLYENHKAFERIVKAVEAGQKVNFLPSKKFSDLSNVASANAHTLNRRKAENLKLAEDYWKSGTDEKHQPKICEMLVDGDIVVVEIVKEINANIKLLR